MSFFFGLREHEVQCSGFTNPQLNVTFERYIKLSYESVSFDDAPAFIAPGSSAGGESLILRYASGISLKDGVVQPRGENQESEFTGWLIVQDTPGGLQKVLARAPAVKVQLNHSKPERTGWFELRENGDFVSCDAVVENHDLLYTPDEVIETTSGSANSKGMVQVHQMLMYTAPLKKESLGWKQPYAVTWKPAAEVQKSQ